MYQDILTKLDVREQEEGKLPLLLEFYRALLSVQADAQARLAVPEPGLSKEEIDARIRNGQPLLGFEKIDLDMRLLGEVFAEVVAAYRAYPALFDELPGEPAPALTEELARAWYEGKPLPGVSGAGARLVQAMLQAAMNPFLKRYSRVLMGSVNIEFWRRSYCPVCGGRPDFSYLDKERGSRWLVCSRCDTEWVYQRLQCPFCGTKDQNALTLFTDEKEMYRLYGCEQCKSYLKTIDLRKTDDEVLIPLERLLTLEMDRQAREEGYGLAV